MTTVTDGAVVAVAVVAVVSVRTGSPIVAIALALLVAPAFVRSARSPPLLVGFVVLLAVGAAMRSQHEWAGLVPDSLGAYEG